MIKVTITDDHPTIAEGIRSMFEAKTEIQVGQIFTTAKATLENINEENTDVLLLDINLPDMDGFEVCKQVKKKYPGIQILAFTSYKESSFLRSIIQNGAAGFLLKNSTFDEIMLAIVTVFNKEEYIQNEMKELLLSESLSRKTNHTFIPKLTRREKEILNLILEEFTTQQIADQLFVSPRTVETHRLNLIQKLGVKNTAGLVKVTIERGLLK